MTTRVLLLLCVLTPYCAGACLPPAPALEKLKAYLVYENGLGKNDPKVDSFNMLPMGDWLFFRLETSPTGDAAERTPVYAYRPSAGIDTFSCRPHDWQNCVREYARSAEGREAVQERSSAQTTVQTCQFTLSVPPWMPSPDDAAKRKVAAEILGEVRKSLAVSRPKTIWLRDFNLDDPEIWMYITTSRYSTPQGCSFDRARIPHCNWHMFGQTPEDWLRRQIMTRAYRLFPLPFGPAGAPAQQRPKR